MADADRRTFPKVPAKNWFDLRRRIKQALPSAISIDYLQSVLGLEAPSARNLMSPLRATGLIDDDGRLTELAHEWRSDEGYAAACAAILASVYPGDLTAAFPGPDVDRDGVSRWFMRNARVGEAAGRQLAAFYLLLANPSLEDEAEARQRTSPAERRPRASSATKPAGKGAPVSAAGAAMNDVSKTPTRQLPSMHIDVQVHIDPTASAEQIDQIFASMGRHLYGRE